MRTSEYEGVILIPPHTCRLKISTRNTHFYTPSSAQTGGGLRINRDKLYDIFGKKDNHNSGALQLKRGGRGKGEEGGGLLLVNLWGSSSFIRYYMPPNCSCGFINPTVLWSSTPPLNDSTVKIGSFFRLFAVIKQSIEI